LGSASWTNRRHVLDQRQQVGTRCCRHRNAERSEKMC
jgi:hypothetical protein